jgi:Arc/MetJ-type ribon-helix-helix transcriptional regulator
MLQHALDESIMLMPTTDDSELRNSTSVSIYPITRQQWEALQLVASGRGGTRSDLFREAIGQLLEERDNGEVVTYTAAPRLHPDEKAGTKPRIVWLKSPLAEQFRGRCNADRVSQSEFVLEALRRYLKSENITIDPAI